MRFIVDTHALLWWLAGDPSIGPFARERLASDDSQAVVSAASLWEVAIKQGLGRVDADIGEIERSIAAQGFERLGIEAGHLVELLSLPAIHRDPFDRMLIAQARAEDMPIMTADQAIARYAVDLIAAER